MAGNIDALLARLEDPTEVFTCDEVKSLIDCKVQQALSNDYQLQRVASALQQSVQSTELVSAAAQQLVSLWNNASMVPTLNLVVFNEE